MSQIGDRSASDAGFILVAGEVNLVRNRRDSFLEAKCFGGSVNRIATKHDQRFDLARFGVFDQSLNRL